ncbi:MAG TPA: M23 family metallopeptidase [Gaiellaceae bacterium]|nr:M23 family metallopeptidase [Gaiellaceae bacterium]
MLLRLTTRLMAIPAVFLIWVPVAHAWSWPVQGPVLQSFSYDEAHPYAAGQHRGIDIGAAATGVPVIAPESGTVSFAGSVPTNGNSLTIETADGYAVTLTHLGSISVAKGAAVTEGAVVGTVGPSGTAEEPGPYVHLGIRLGADANGYLDPLTFLPAPVSPASDYVPVPKPVPSARSVPAVASPANPGSAGIVIRDQRSAPSAGHSARAADAGSLAPKRPSRTEKRPSETVSKPRTFEGTVDEPVVLDHVPVAPTRATPRSALVPDGLAAGPGVVAVLAALIVALGRRRRRPPAIVVRFPLGSEDAPRGLKQRKTA